MPKKVAMGGGPSALVADGIQFQVVEITPALAEEWLERNTRNRTTKPHRIDAMCRTMAAGRWRLTHQGIAFDTDGVLIDGQNRLSAVVKSGLSIKMLVATNVPRDSMFAIDRGAMRSTADTLTILRGLEYATFKVAVARLILATRQGISHKSRVFTDEEIDDEIVLHHADYEWLISVAQHNPKISRAPIAAALLYARQVRRSQIDEFVQLINEPEGLPKHSPVYPAMLLVNERQHVGRGSLRERMSAFRKMLRCAHAFCLGEALKITKDSDQGLDYFVALHRKKEQGGRNGRAAA